MDRSISLPDNPSARHSNVRRFCASDPRHALHLARAELRDARRSHDEGLLALCETTVGICEMYARHGIQAERHLSSALGRCERLRNAQGIASATLYLGILNSEESKFDTALRWLRRSLEAAHEAGAHRETAFALNALGVLYKDAGMYDYALTYLLRSLGVSQTHAIGQLIPAVHHNLASVYEEIGDLEAMHEQCMLAIPLKKTNGDTRGLANSHLALGNLAAERGEQDVALTEYERARTLFASLQDDLGVAQAISNAAIIHESRLDWSRAEPLYREALERARRAKSPRTACGILFNLAKVEAATGRTKRSIGRMNAALRSAQRTGAQYFEQMILRTLAEMYEREGNHAMAIPLLRRYVEVHERILGASTQVAIHRLRMLYAIRTSTDATCDGGESMSDSGLTCSNQADADIDTTTQESLILYEILTSIKQRLGKISSKAVDPGIRRALTSLSSEIECRIKKGAGSPLLDGRYHHVYSQLIGPLRQAAPNLSKTELKVCALIRLHMATDEIAGLMGVDPGTIHDHRHTIRRKLGLERRTSLDDYVRTL